MAAAAHSPEAVCSFSARKVVESASDGCVNDVPSYAKKEGLLTLNFECLGGGSLGLSCGCSFPDEVESRVFGEETCGGDDLCWGGGGDTARFETIRLFSGDAGWEPKTTAGDGGGTDGCRFDSKGLDSSGDTRLAGEAGAGADEVCVIDN